MKKLLATGALLVGLLGPASASFVGAFAPANWSQFPGDGSVNVFNETALAITSGNAGWESFTDVSITVPIDGQISFDWAYGTADVPAFELFGVTTFTPDYSFFELSDSLGASEQSGTFSLLVTAGDVFAFTARSLDGLGGSATVHISEFSFEPTPPLSVPVPGSSTLLVAALIAVAAARRNHRLQPTLPRL